MLPHNIGAILWYIILAVAWCVYLVLESFIVGSGMLQRFGTTYAKQRSIQLSGGLHYDGIEVWLITAVGGTFAAFPTVYAVILESLYIPFYLLITALILRAVTIEFMYKDESATWQKSLSLIWGISSFLIPFILGVYFANIFRGLAFDQNGYHGSIIGLFDIIGLSGGLFITANAFVTGTPWIKFTTIIEDNASSGPDKIPVIAAVIELLALVVLFLGLNNKSTLFTAGFYSKVPALWILPVLSIVAAGATIFFTMKKKSVLQFISGILTMLLTMASLFSAAFPSMVLSSMNPAVNVDIYNGASSQLTLTIMTYVAAVFVPLVIAYQAWKFIRFRNDRNEEIV